MPGKIFFRDGYATVTSTELIIGSFTLELSEILEVRSVRRRSLLPLFQPSRFALILRTAEGDCEVLRERDGYVVFQLANAIEAALREAKHPNGQPHADGDRPAAGRAFPGGSLPAPTPEMGV